MYTPDVRKIEKPAALPGLAAIITLEWPSFMTGTVIQLVIKLGCRTGCRF